MNNFFKILWFEDNTVWYNARMRSISLHLESFYIVLEKIDWYKTGKNFDINLLKNNHYDLILMDFKLLGDSPTGSEIIKIIRDNDVLTDILFYSSDYDNMIAAVKEKIPAVDGVYLSNRQDDFFEPKVCKLIDKIIHRSEDISNLRGNLLEATTDYESKMQSFLSDLWENADENRKKLLQNIVCKEILEKRRSHLEDVLNKNPFDLKRMNESDFVLFMNDRLNIAVMLSEQEKKNDVLIDNKNIKDYYMWQLGTFRNKLSHVKVGEKIKVYNQEYEINEQFHQMIRKNIHETNKPFDAALNKIKQN